MNYEGPRWTGDGGRRTEEGGRWTVEGGRWTVDGGRWTVDGGRWTVDGGRWTVDGGRWTVKLRPRLIHASHDLLQFSKGRYLHVSYRDDILATRKARECGKAVDDTDELRVRRAIANSDDRSRKATLLHQVSNKHGLSRLGRQR